MRAFGGDHGSEGFVRRWHQDRPLTAAQGALLYSDLVDKMPMHEFTLRRAASGMAYNWMMSCKQKGGCQAGEKGNFVDPNAKQFGGKGDEGISIAVFSGHAFVP
jgi:hypothetical protein